MSKILIIDDTAEHRLLFSRALENAGFQTHTAEDGEDGLTEYASALLDDDPFDLIVLDMGMPFMNGYEVADRIRATGDDTTPILFLSAHFEGHTQRMDDYCPSAFLAKPVHQHQLVQTIAATVQTQAALND